MHRMAKIIHSYSLECGIISPNTVNVLPDPINQDFEVKGLGFASDPCENNKHKMYHYKGDDGPLFTEDMYRNLGKNLLVSVLDVFDKNPFNRVYNSQYKSMDMLRRITAF
jgi:cytosolic carboxypeptidase protein 5